MKVLIVDDRPLGARKLSDDILSAEPDYLVEMAAPVGTITAADRARQFVQDARERFDVFLIDDNLGAGLNGSELMTELRKLSPSSEAIIFTAYADEDGKQSAIEAGARAYVPRPVNERELLWQLRGIQQERSIRRERDWLQLLARMTERLQLVSSAQEAGDAIVDGVRQLGFQRARLRMVVGGHGEKLELIGVSEMGNIGLRDDYTTIKRSLKDLPYSHKVLIETQQPTLFHSRELGEAPWDEFIGPPKDDWFKVPLFVGDTPIGTLSLDNGADSCKYTVAEREFLQQLLDQFGRQAATALERARLQEEAQRKAATQELLNEISLVVTEQVAKGDLHELCDVLRRQIHEHLQLGASGFAVALLDKDDSTSHYLDYCYEYRNGQTRQNRYWCDYANDPAKTWIAQLIEDGRQGKDPANHQIGVPLRVQEDVIGVMLIDGGQKTPFLDETIYQQLVAIAARVAGPIQAVYREEREKVQHQRETLRKKLIEKLRKLASTDENHFWHALLTFATHRNGYGFNRAVLFRYRPEEHILQGRIGIGHFTFLSWERDVTADAAAGDRRSFAAYLDLPSAAHLHITPLATAVLNWRRRLSNDQQDPFRLVCERGERQVLTAAELKQWLPVSEFIPLTMRPSAQCVLIPWKRDDRMLGVLLVDNAMDDKPMRPEDIAALQALLAEASQILNEVGETIKLRRQGESYERILRFSWLLTTQAAGASLKHLLTKLCQEICDIAKADYVVLYPLSRDGINYDTTAIATAGTPRDPEYLAQHRPRPQGTAAYVLRQGTLAVNDVMKSTLKFEGRPLSHQKYILREGVAAFIGVPIHMAVSARPLGVLYLDYRRPQTFSTSDISQAEQLASVASTVIGTTYRVEDEAERYTRESALLQAIHEESLADDTDEKKVISVVLRTAQELFNRQADTILMLRQWDTDEKQEIVKEQYRYRRWNLLTYYEDVTPSSAVKGLIHKAFDEGAAVSEGDMLAVPIKTAYRMMGCISVAKSEDITVERVERLANSTAAALDNIRRELRLRAMLKAIQQVVEPMELKETLKEVITGARIASHGLECVTLWYRDPDSKKHVLGAYWGLLEETQDVQDPGGGATQTQHEIVLRVMESQDPTWIENIDAAKTPLEQELIKGPFGKRQKIVSAVAFPLWVKNECIGALFFNYRLPHKFSPGERHALKIFAAIAAASIHDAQLLEQLDVVRAIVEAVGTNLDLDKVLQEVLAALQKYFSEPNVLVQPYIMLYDESEDCLYLPTVARAFAPVDNPRYKDRLRLHLDGSDKGLVCRVARVARQVKDIYVENIIDAKKDPDFLYFNSKTASLLCAGLATSGRLWGVLAVSSSKQGAFDEQDKLLLRLAAQQALIAMERSEQAAKLRFREAASSVTTWAAELVHDINRDVYSIRSRADWLRRRDKSLSEQGRVWVEEIDDIAKRLAEAARSTRSDQQADRQTFLLDQALYSDVLDLVSRRWPNVTVQTDFGCDNITIYTSRERLWRVVRHLVRNAAEAMNESGTLTIRTRCGETRVEVHIEDTGPGVPEDIRTRLLTERLTTKETEGDRGYGLLIARSLLESIGGQIDLLPQKAGHDGAVFSIALPRVSIMIPPASTLTE